MSKTYFVKKIENKLILVSRDIQVGDNVKYEDKINGLIDDKVLSTDGYISLQNNGLVLPTECFKVIGEISPEATCIEGQEFTEDEIKLLTII